MRIRSLFRLARFLSVGSTMVLVTGCESGSGGRGGNANEPAVTEVDNGFESDDPAGQTAETRRKNAGGDPGGGATAGADAPAGEESADSAAPERIVQEADVIKVDGNRLYALSQYGGMSIIDITNPDHMTVLGRKRTEGKPFEMYVDGGKAFITMNEISRFVRTGSNGWGRWVHNSAILTLDVTNPAAMSEVAHFDVPGTISDSRKVGDITYVVTQEMGGCWGCQSKPATIVTSFKVGSTITKADQLVYAADDAQFQGWQRSVSATNERFYIAGRDWRWTGGSENAGSIIQVIDISDPTGKLVKGADIQVAGAITSRWQMDEYQGVLRVVSQPGNGGWGNSSANPRVQTYTVSSASSITPLGATDLILPKPESLRSVRFDGPRGYAITAEQRWNMVCDPLFTIDLSNPAEPKQKGELEMPGWVFHIEPRGDRLIAFGYDDIDQSRAKVAVSIFDVSGDMSTPTLLKRVAFGQGWSTLTQDQDRIHKAVRILDDQGLILVPFASSPRWGSAGCEKAQSGIQLVDFTRDDLTLRGVAPSYGIPRRAFTANGRLLAMSDRNVASFDIASRDQPVKKHDVDLSNPAYRLAETPTHIASVTSDWGSGEVMLSLTPKSNADSATPTGKVSLASLAPNDPALCGAARVWTSWYEARLFANGNTVYVAVPLRTNEQVPNTDGPGVHTKTGGKLLVAAVDTSDPTKPSIVGKTTSEFVSRDVSDSRWWGSMWMDGRGGPSIGAGEQLVRHGSKLAYLELDIEYAKVIDDTVPNPNPESPIYRWLTPQIHRRLHVIDLTNPAAPITPAPIQLPASLGLSPLNVVNGTVLTSRWVESPIHPDKVKFYVDRVDVAGASPLQIASLNVPGALLLADEPSSRFATMDYTVTNLPATNYTDCYAASGRRGLFFDDTKRCIVITRDLKLVDVDHASGKVSLRQKFDLPAQNIFGVQVAEDRLYIGRSLRYDHDAYQAPGTEPPVLETGGLWAIGGIRAGNLSVVSEMVGESQVPLFAHGSKVALLTASGIAIMDTTSAQPSLIGEVNRRGRTYGSTHVLMTNDKATCSLGEYGLQTIAY